MASNADFAISKAVPDIFLIPSNDIIAKERARLQAELKAATPPKWVVARKEAWDSIAKIPARKRLGSAIGHALFVWSSWALAVLNPLSSPASWIGWLASSVFAYVAFCFAFVEERSQPARKVIVIEPWRILVFLIAHIPGSLGFAFLVERVIRRYSDRFHWNDGAYRESLKRRLAKPPTVILRERYIASLDALEEAQLGPTSPITKAQKALAFQRDKARTDLERLTVRLNEARGKNEATRLSTLELAGKSQRARLAALEAALDELNGKEAKAHGFLAECRELALERAGAAGDEALLRDIQTSAELDGTLIAAADTAGQQLLERLSEAFGNLQRELAEQELNRFTAVLSQGPVACFMESEGRDGPAADKERTGK